MHRLPTDCEWGESVTDHRCEYQEEWRPVVGYEEHYLVSNTGRVRSVDRYTPYGDGPPRFRPGRERKLSSIDGYPHVTLALNGKLLTRKVHQLVCEAFYGPRPSRTHQVRHLNGIRTDNRLENLCWGTPEENAQDTVKHGHHSQSRKTHCPKGHLYDEENTVLYRGSRYCRTCGREQWRTWASKNREYNRERVRKYSGGKK